MERGRMDGLWREEWCDRGTARWRDGKMEESNGENLRDGVEVIDGHPSSKNALR